LVRLLLVASIVVSLRLRRASRWFLLDAPYTNEITDPAGELMTGSTIHHQRSVHAERNGQDGRKPGVHFTAIRGT
jgi:hypothetical protein